MSSSLRKLIQSTYGLKTMVVEPVTNIAVAVNATRILPANYNRLGLTLQNNGGAAIYLSTKKDVAVGEGIRLLALGGSINFKWNEDFDAVGAEWYAIADGGVSVISAMEVIAYGKEE